MTLYDYASGTKANAAAVDSNENTLAIAGHHALVESLWNNFDQATTPKADPAIIKRDVMSDSTGLLNTVDTGNTDATFDTDHYTGLENASEVYSPGVTGSGGGNSYSIACLSKTDGYISQVSILRNASTSGTTTCTIKNAANDTIAEKEIVGIGTSRVFTFAVSDYSSIISDTETFTIQVTDTISSIFYFITTPAQLTGTYWNANTGAATMWSDADGNSVATFQQHNGTAVTVQTEVFTITGNDIDSIYIYAQVDPNASLETTADVSSDNGVTYTADVPLNTKYALSLPKGTQVIIKYNIPADPDAKLYAYCATLGQEN